MEENICLVNKLKANLKCNEQELCKVRRELEECITECNKLHEMNGVLNTELNCTKKCLCEAKLCATRIEERYIQERENLTNELKTCCKKNSDLEMRLDDAMCKLNDERCKSKKFACKLIELNKVSAKNHLEMKNRVQKLQDEMCVKNNELCSLKKKVIELQEENDCKCMEINGLKIKIYERECQLKQMCLLSEKIEQVKCFVESCCCPKKKCEPSPCCPKKKREPSPCCPKNKCEPPSPCCPKKKCEPSPCCPKRKPELCCEPIPCCPKKKPEPCYEPAIPCCPKKKPDSCCKPSCSSTDVKLPCGLSNSTKCMIQKYATKSNNDDTYTAELKKLKCDMEELQQSIGDI